MMRDTLMFAGGLVCKRGLADMFMCRMYRCICWVMRGGKRRLCRYCLWMGGVYDRSEGVEWRSVRESGGAAAARL